MQIFQWKVSPRNQSGDAGGEIENGEKALKGVWVSRLTPKASGDQSCLSSSKTWYGTHIRTGRLGIAALAPVRSWVKVARWNINSLALLGCARSGGA